MFIVSCRKDFDSNSTLAGQHLYRNYSNPQKPSVFMDRTLNDVLDAARNKHVAILVHGFNNTLPEVLGAYWELASNMRTAGVAGASGYGLVLGFTWPGFQTAAGYFAARITARRAGPFLRDLVNAIRPVAHSVDVETHSLGARVALTALSNPKKVFVDNLLLSAPAVDDNLLEPGKEFNAALDGCNRCLVYHSTKDDVLRKSYPLGDAADGIRPALGLRGPRSKPVTLSKCPNVYVVDCSARVDSHGAYRHVTQFLEHWKAGLSGAPLERYGALK